MYPFHFSLRRGGGMEPFYFSDAVTRNNTQDCGYPNPKCICEYATGPHLTQPMKECCTSHTGNCFYVWWMELCNAEQWLANSGMETMDHFQLPCVLHRSPTHPMHLLA